MFSTYVDLHAGAELQQIVYLEAECTLSMDQAAIHSSSQFVDVSSALGSALHGLRCLDRTCKHDKIIRVHFALPWHMRHLCMTVTLLPQLDVTKRVSPRSDHASSVPAEAKQQQK